MRGWNKETIEEQLRLHKRQNKDNRYNYFEKEFNCLWYCWELEKYTIKEIERLHSIIKEVRDYTKKHFISTDGEICIYFGDHTCEINDNFLDELLQILDKEKENE